MKIEVIFTKIVTRDLTGRRFLDSRTLLLLGSLAACGGDPTPAGGSDEGSTGPASTDPTSTGAEPEPTTTGAGTSEGTASGSLDDTGASSSSTGAPVDDVPPVLSITSPRDGRARTLPEAILWHGGEAEAARDAYTELSAEDRERLHQLIELL